MHIVSFLKNKKVNAGVLQDKDSVIDLSYYSKDVPNDLNQIIELNCLDKLENIKNNPTTESVIKITDVKILAPIPVPKRDIICVGLNYHDHAKEFHSSGYDSNKSKNPVP